MSKFKKIIIITGITIFVAIFLFLPFFIKVKIECLSQYGDCPQEVVTLINSYNGKSLAVAKNGIKKSLKNNLQVSEFSTQFKLPNILVVNVLIKKPFYVLKNDAGQLVSIGKDGEILGSVNSTSLPTVFVLGNLKKVGEKVDTNELFALNLVAGVNQMYQVNFGQIIDDSLVVELPANIKVLFPLDGDSQVLLGSLRLVYGKIESTQDKSKYKEIDLRFKNPVLR